ncbi:uncharacterized protein LOC133716317 [Rosa rugosa]|uniref:uncharacterized protein LOC133716317 n=1 Tax=Rosa rugosa TaxID=74645 RepID=UPI002B4142BF|nr:uncharacterized protein LOC133716317 [Rosa rugosa]
MAETVSASAIVLQVLGRENYEDWSVRVRTYLMAKDLWDVVEARGEPPKPEKGEAKYKTWRKNNAEALHAIQISCGPDTFPLIRDKITAKTAWNTLVAEFKPDLQKTPETVTGSAIVLQGRDNYEDWSVRVRDYLLAKDLWDVVEAPGEPPKPQQGEAIYKTWTENNAEALHAIQNSCGPDTLPLIRDKITAKTAWNTLIAAFKPDLQKIPGNANNFHQYEALFRAVKDGDCNATNEFLEKNKNAVSARITYLGKTALHTAADAGRTKIVELLVKKMRKEDLVIQGNDGKTALVVAINRGDMEMVKCMVRKNKNIVRILDRSNRLPVVLAYRNSFWEIARYLYSITPPEDLNGSINGATLVSQCFYAQQYDIAWDLIHRCPNLITTKDLFEESPLFALASVPSAFPSGMPLIFWKKWIYNCIHIQPASPFVNITIEDDTNTNNNNTTATSTSSSSSTFHKNFICSGINHIYRMKLVHTRSSEFLEYMCDRIKSLNSEQMKDGVVQSSVLRAVERGIPEFVKSICNANRELARSTNEMGRSIFHYAIECRQEKVYNLIYGHDMRNAISSLTDAYNNNMLHMAALLSPFAQLNRIPSAALQMQRELQWFKEVETVVAPKAREFINWTDYMTPRDLFTKHHRNLLKEGEKWMKDTATSFTVVGALIVTLMFATAFTIPGGYKGDTGFPIFINERLFMVFIISDAISLFSATTSSLMFLGILTSRYAEDDFLKFLPTKMIIGLFTLFFSIATMMIAFSAALLLILKEKPWTTTPIILLSCVPVTLFAAIKIPLLVEILLSTYGRGIFDKNACLDFDLEKWLQQILHLESEPQEACRADVNRRTHKAIDRDHLVDLSIQLPLYGGVPDGVVELLGLDAGAGARGKESVPAVEVPVADLQERSVDDVVHKEAPLDNVLVDISSGETKVASQHAPNVSSVVVTGSRRTVERVDRVVASECVRRVAESLASLVSDARARSTEPLKKKRKGGGTRLGHLAMGLSLNLGLRIRLDKPATKGENPSPTLVVDLGTPELRLLVV